MRLSHGGLREGSIQRLAMDAVESFPPRRHSFLCWCSRFSSARSSDLRVQVDVESMPPAREGVQFDGIEHPSGHPQCLFGAKSKSVTQKDNRRHIQMNCL